MDAERPIPVLSVRDPDRARSMLESRFGFADAGMGFLRLGAQVIHVSECGVQPPELMALTLDHVAFSVASADVAWRRYSALGSKVDVRFTPHGPRTIADFGVRGARFVFFAGPEGAPVEFCEMIGEAHPEASVGHGHYGIRTADVAGLTQQLVSQGGRLRVSHCLSGAAGPVNVAFVDFRGAVLELFDEPPMPGSSEEKSGWIGLVPGGAAIR